MRMRLFKLLLLPFYLLAIAIDVTGWIMRNFFGWRHFPTQKSAFGPGISIVIPERANKEMLRRCLESLQIACACLEEPVETIVVVSGAVEDAYQDLMRSFSVHWIFQARPLWFIEAIAVGVDVAQYDWVYLLNSDMIIDSDALREVAKWRSPSVFAIASQIYFQDSTRRREETGLTGVRIASKLLEIFDAEPNDEYIVRPHLYAGGGSSLFRRGLLRDFIAQTKGYEPAYWEDVEWGILAWRRGFQVLFRAQSKVWHAHRSTILKLFSPEETDRIFRRNRLRFQLRTALPPGSLRTVFGSIARLDDTSFWEMLNPASAMDTLRSRFRCYFEPRLKLETILQTGIYYSGRCRRPGMPLILIVSPYCIYPPAHGGARRIHELIDRLAQEFDIVLLSDEAENYSDASLKYFEKCHQACLIGGRRAPDHDGRIERILAHSHTALARQLRALVQIHNPDIVQIEYIELAKLIEERDRRPWILTLHDVWLGEPGANSRYEDEFERQYIKRFDTVIVCGPEDRALLQDNDVPIVPNGAHVTMKYMPSPADGPILFLGPFRYPPNFIGIVQFLECVFPAVRARVPAARLWILGGPDAQQIAARHACFDQPGVTVFDLIEDVSPYLRDCSISINPDKNVRGTSLKVIEFLTAGRMCVSTQDGARGFLESHPASLIIIDENSFADSVVQLLTDIEYRHGLEAPTEELHRYSWQRAAEEQSRIYKFLLQTGYSIQTHA
jgi:GT2 family glycosyltransferase/glycosyltransferase involved in cell wall biosynthesis